LVYREGAEAQRFFDYLSKSRKAAEFFDFSASLRLNGFYVFLP
jgi:hypothetical protein